MTCSRCSTRRSLHEYQVVPPERSDSSRSSFAHRRRLDSLTGKPARSNRARASRMVTRSPKRSAFVLGAGAAMAMVLWPPMIDGVQFAAAAADNGSGPWARWRGNVQLLRMVRDLLLRHPVWGSGCTGGAPFLLALDVPVGQVGERPRGPSPVGGSAVSVAAQGPPGAVVPEQARAAAAGAQVAADDVRVAGEDGVLEVLAVDEDVAAALDGGVVELGVADHPVVDGGRVFGERLDRVR